MAGATPIMPERRMIMMAAALIAPSLPPPTHQPDNSVYEYFFNFENVLAHVLSCQGLLISIILRPHLFMPPTSANDNEGMLSGNILQRDQPIPDVLGMDWSCYIYIQPIMRLDDWIVSASKNSGSAVPAVHVSVCR